MVKEKRKVRPYHLELAHAQRHLQQLLGDIARGDWAMANKNATEAVADLRWVRDAMRELLEAES